MIHLFLIFTHCSYEFPGIKMVIKLLKYSERFETVDTYEILETNKEVSMAVQTLLKSFSDSILTIDFRFFGAGMFYFNMYNKVYTGMLNLIDRRFLFNKSHNCFLTHKKFIREKDELFEQFVSKYGEGNLESILKKIDSFLLEFHENQEIKTAESKIKSELIK